MRDELGEGEGEVNLIAWAGYVEDGSTDPKVDWVSDFEKDTGCQVNVKIGNTSDEMVTLMRTGQLRRRVGLGRRHAAPDRRRRRRAGQHRPDPELRGRLRRPEGQAVQLGRRPDVRHPARPRREPAMWNAPTRSSRRPTRGASSGTTNSPVQGQGHGLRQPDLHRRRGGVPEGDAARPRDRRTRTSSTTSSSSAASTCSRSSARSSASTGRTTPRSRPRSRRATRSSGTTWQVIANLLEADEGARSRRRCPRRARPAGRTPG